MSCQTCTLKNAITERQWATHFFTSHHFLYDFPQGSSLYVLSNEIESLVFVEDADELEHIGVIQAAHHFHLRAFSYVVINRKVSSQVRNKLGVKSYNGNFNGNKIHQKCRFKKSFLLS